MEQKSFKELKDVGRKGFVAELVNPFRIISRTECVEDEDLEMDLGPSAKFESQPLHSTPPNMFEQQMIDPKIMARALAIVMEQAQQKKGMEEPNEDYCVVPVEYDTAKILKYHIDEEELKQYMEGAEMPSKIKKLICREHCLFLHRENQQRFRGEKHEFYPSTVLKKQLACHLVGKFPDMADSDGGCIEMEFERMHPGASDAEFRKMFAKIAEAANVQHDDDLASLSSAILPKRCKKQLVERVESVQAMAEKNPALTIVKDISPGNLKAILALMEKCGNNAEIDEHLRNPAKNATYRSKTTQNELIHICGNSIGETLTGQIKDVWFFSALADQAADISNIEQMAIVVRFVDTDSVIREQFLGFCASRQGSFRRSYF
eukprot:gene13493-biopygen10068